MNITLICVLLALFAVDIVLLKMLDNYRKASLLDNEMLKRAQKRISLLEVLLLPKEMCSSEPDIYYQSYNKCFDQEYRDKFFNTVDKTLEKAKEYAPGTDQS